VLHDSKLGEKKDAMSPRLKLLIFVFLSLLFLPRVCVRAEPEILEFYVISCPECEGFKERVRVLEGTYPQGIIVFYDIAEGENAKRFKMISGLLNETLYMPLVGVFVNGELTAIASGGLESEDWRIAVEVERDFVSIYVAKAQGRTEIKPPVEELVKLETITRLFRESVLPIVTGETDYLRLFTVVVIAAFMDAINPCCLSVLLVLLTFVFYGVGKKAVLRVGLAFTVGIFVAYFILGLGLMRVFQHVLGIKYIVSLVAIVLGSLRIVEGLGVKVKHIPASFASRISTRIEEASNPRIGFGAGIVTGFLMLPCSSAPYFIVLSLLSERASMTAGLAFLVLYNFIIIVPFIAVTVVIYSLMSTTMEMKLWSLENRRWINLLMGVGLILLSVINLLMHARA
jgi:cytochrome c biogenesis protein CcdA